MEGTHSFSGTAPPPAAAHYLPGNPLPYLAPSATHQPELLLLSWMIATLRTLVTDLQNHPILTDPIRYPSSFTDQQAYRLYLQVRNTLRHLVTIIADLCQGISILQFLPTTPAFSPPPKTPPFPAPSPPKHCNTPQPRTARSATGASHKPPPPSPSTTTSSEDPVLLMTNVPILKKARPGQPPLRPLAYQDPPSTTLVPPPALAPSLLHPPPLQTQVRIPRPRHNGRILPFHFSHHILEYLDSNKDRPSTTPAAPPYPAPPPAFPAHGIPPPPQPAPPALFPPLPPLPELPLTDQQANQLTTAILRIARRAAAAAATNMLADHEP